MNIGEKNIIEKEKSFRVMFLVAIFSFLFLISLASAEEFGYNYLEGELNVAQAVNYTLVSVNDSLLWNGNPWSDTRWLNIDGSNANQNVNINPYDFIVDDVMADLVWANDMQIWDDTLNADAILSMYTHDLSNSFVLSVTDAGATDFSSGEQLMFRSEDDLFTFAQHLYTGTGLYIDVSENNPYIWGLDGILEFSDQLNREPRIIFDLSLTNPLINSSTNILNFSNVNLTTTGNITASWFNGIFNWVIGSTSTNYLSFNGTHLDFDETQLNATIENIVDTAGAGLWEDEGTIINSTGHNIRVENITHGAIINSTLNQIYVENTEEEYIIWI